jgi:hypothetical protein
MVCSKPKGVPIATSPHPLRRLNCPEVHRVADAIGNLQQRHVAERITPDDLGRGGCAIVKDTSMP